MIKTVYGKNFKLLKKVIADVISIILSISFL